ncbi:MAG: N-acetylglucosamine-6-phosphate deacetylase [Butyrivibrio sp.]|nr:N-acetylglucosamine-6-phosphate deacetylase [Butyrivibrio sp.]
MIIKGASVYTREHRFEKKNIITDGIMISALCASDEVRSNTESNEESGEGKEILDAIGLYAIPGLVDIHFHGAMGHDFCDADPDGLKEIARYEAKRGILAICPATMTYSEDILSGIMENAASFTADEDMAELVGINMEGPFISPEKIGAQNPKYLMKPDASMFRRLQAKANGLIKLVDIAPELEGSIDFIKALSDDVKISIAHTACDYDTAIDAFNNGAGHVTHLFNAMPGLNHRDPGPIRAAMEKDAEVEIIADGVHIHPAMVRMAFETFSEDKVILIADSMEATGLPDGEYQLGGQKVSVCGKKAVLSEHPDTIAGSVSNLFDCMKTAINMGIKKELVIRAASENPAKAIGISDRFGKISEGYMANIVLVDGNFEIKYVINRGMLIK